MKTTPPLLTGKSAAAGDSDQADLRDINTLQALSTHVSSSGLRINVNDLDALAKQMGSSGTYLFRYLKNDWRATEAPMRKLEERIMLFLTQSAEEKEEPVMTNTKLVSRDFIVDGVRKFLDHVRSHNYIGIGYGDAGAGKTKACEIYAAQRSVTTLYIHVNMWKGGRHAVVKLIKKAAGIVKVPKGECVEDHLVTRLKGSGMLLVIDNAHRMTEAARRFLADFWEESKLSIALIGNPEIEDQWDRNDQHGSRVGLLRDVTLTLADTKVATARHMLEIHLPEAAGNGVILKEAEAILEGFGLCRSVEKRAQLARSILLSDKNTVTDPALAWRMAKEQLPKGKMKAA